MSGRMSLASDGARQLLLAMARAHRVARLLKIGRQLLQFIHKTPHMTPSHYHPSSTASEVMFECTWRPIMDAFLVPPKPESTESAFGVDALSFLVDLLLMRPKARQHKSQKSPPFFVFVDTTLNSHACV